jgi:molybdate transport system ATP-binding protein
LVHQPQRGVLSTKSLTVELSHISLLRDGRRILRGIDWCIRPGQRWVLLGANGAGKTQLLKLVSGDVWPAATRSARRIYLWQGQPLDEPQSVKEEIAYIGSERQDRYEHYDWNLRLRALIGTGIYRTDIPLFRLTLRDRTRIDRLLARFKLKALCSRKLQTLSYGQRRLALIARAVAMQPALLLLDEVLNGLDGRHRELVQSQIAQLDKSVGSWVLATHRAEDIPARATHLLQLERGHIVWQGRLTATRRRQLVASARPGSIRTMAQTAAVSARNRDDVALIGLRNAWVWLDGRAVLRRLTFSIQRGQCWVVHGPNGSGKSTLIRALYGDLGVASQGTIRRRGIDIGVAISEFKRQVGLVAPELQTLHPLWMSVLEVVVSGMHSSIGLDEPPVPAEIRRARRALLQMGMAAMSGRVLRQLSYGQMRRVLFARAWVHEPDILLLDEPFTGLDRPTRMKLQSRIESLSRDGTTIVLTTHHRDEWPAAASHELQLSGGVARYCGPVRNS